MTCSGGVGILDTGIGTLLTSRVAAARHFSLGADGVVRDGPRASGLTGHGTAVAYLILEAEPSAQLFDAQVFGTSGRSAPASIAAGLDWLRISGVRLVNMSFGLRADRSVLRNACDRAVNDGMILVAATPARGGLVYPAGYCGVIAVCGDARCQPGEISTLAGTPASFGASPFCPAALSSEARVGGASIATARITGFLAANLRNLVDARSGLAASSILYDVARYQGREMRALTSPLIE